MNINFIVSLVNKLGLELLAHNSREIMVLKIRVAMAHLSLI